MWYLNENGDISQNKSNIKLTNEQANAAINAKTEGKIVSYEDGELIFTDMQNDKTEQDREALTAEQTTNKTKSIHALLMAEANQSISILQDAVDAEIATNEETTALTEWKKYRVLLNRIDVEKAQDIDWPTKPE